MSTRGSCPGSTWFDKGVRYNSPSDRQSILFEWGQLKFGERNFWGEALSTVQHLNTTMSVIFKARVQLNAHRSSSDSTIWLCFILVSRAWPEKTTVTVWQSVTRATVQWIHAWSFTTYRFTTFRSGIACICVERWRQLLKRLRHAADPVFRQFPIKRFWYQKSESLHKDNSCCSIFK